MHILMRYAGKLIVNIYIAAAAPTVVCSIPFNVINQIIHIYLLFNEVFSCFNGCCVFINNLHIIQMVAVLDDPAAELKWEKTFVSINFLFVKGSCICLNSSVKFLFRVFCLFWRKYEYVFVNEILKRRLYNEDVFSFFFFFFVAFSYRIIVTLGLCGNRIEWKLNFFPRRGTRWRRKKHKEKMGNTVDNGTELRCWVIHASELRDATF